MPARARSPTEFLINIRVRGDVYVNIFRLPVMRVRNYGRRGKKIKGNGQARTPVTHGRLRASVFYTKKKIWTMADHLGKPQNFTHCFEK
ncbi:hypothetical protein EVAR_60361_1 [Eumeta japonica]|uniref:Uncharacterized protein n=1 Tax=Eumeta variegata TaxID=151549 RepID=A0A4C1Z7Y7_EUMVA|nr:hypothetical protein EVAR_60361_1 [Eumeta japonica]